MSLPRARLKGIDYVYSAALISFDPKNEDLLRKTNIEGTANIVNFVLPKEKLCYISSTAALGDLANETIITEEIEWNPENRTVIMRFLNMVPKWKSEVSKKG
jgi:thioester reductase-like protein